jgi:hypothetical protein
VLKKIAMARASSCGILMGTNVVLLKFICNPVASVKSRRICLSFDAAGREALQVLGCHQRIEAQGREWSHL